MTDPTSPVGFINGITAGWNADFSGSASPAVANGLVANGKLWIGSATPNGNNTKINVGSITSPNSTITVGYSSPNITIDLAGGGAAVEHLTGTTGGQLNPTLNNFNLLGGTSAAGTTPVSVAGSVSTLTTNVQISQAIAATDATKIGLAAFNSGDFSVDANGFVSIISGGFQWTDVTGATQTLVAENGYITDRGGGVTYTLPASGSIGDEIRIVGKAGLATITPNANQQILMGSASGTVGVTGTAVATNAGDCIELICTTSGASTVWRACNWVGNWTLN